MNWTARLIYPIQIHRLAPSPSSDLTCEQSSKLHTSGINNEGLWHGPSSIPYAVRLWDRLRGPVHEILILQRWLGEAWAYSKIVSMIRKYHNHKLQTSPWHREEEPHNNHETPGIQTKQSNHLSLPHQDDCRTRRDIKKRTTNHRTNTDSHNGSNNKQQVNNNRTTASERTAA